MSIVLSIVTRSISSPSPSLAICARLGTAAYSVSMSARCHLIISTRWDTLGAAGDRQ
eukprot:COSAG01_NODE_212_length_21797_cov_14.197806_24_plen_57_part_00